MRQFVAVLLLLWVGLIGCGNSETSARKSLGGVEGQRTLAELDDDQLETVCDAADAKLAAALEDESNANGACLLTAHITARAVAASDDEIEEVDVCDDTLEQCLDRPLESASRCGENVASRCLATVADFDRCITLANALYADLGELECADISDDDSDELDEQIQQSVDACDKLAGCFVDEQPDASTPDEDAGDEPDTSVADPDDDDAGV